MILFHAKMFSALNSINFLLLSERYLFVYAALQPSKQIYKPNARHQLSLAPGEPAVLSQIF